MQLRGIKDLLAFLIYLQGISRSPWYRLLIGLRPEAVTVELAIPGLRVDVDFFEDRVEWHSFGGDESVLDDHARIFALIEQAKGVPPQIN